MSFGKNGILESLGKEKITDETDIRRNDGRTNRIAIDLLAKRISIENIRKTK